LAEPPLAASSNVHLLARIPGTAAGMNFKDHYAYVSGWGGITVLDMGDGAERHVHGRSRRLEGARHGQLLVDWFDAKDGVAAVGWYEQGVRFLNYSSPTDITRTRSTASCVRC
jgi:hypothetical protein